MDTEGRNEEDMIQTLLNRSRWMAPMLGVMLTGACQSGQTTPPTAQPIPFPPTTTQSIPTTGLSIELRLIEGDASVPSFYMSTHEIDWDVFDAFVFELDEPPVKGTPEAETRPTRPYMLVDRGFGHAGYPAISMSQRGAEAFCLWLSDVTNRTYRLPTMAEWTLACQRGGVTDATMAEHAWFEANAQGTTHPIGTRAPDANGLFDLHGNVAEWATDSEGNGSVMGGSFISPRNELTCTSFQPYTRDWNESDPQIPKSVWWLADGAFIGFRVVHVPSDQLEQP